MSAGMGAGNPALIEQLAEIARAVREAGHGGKTAIYKAAAQRLGVSIPTLLNRLKQVQATKPRKRRADAGSFALSRSEALLVAATVEETRRLTGTGEISLENAIAVLRANGKIGAAHVDEETGEVRDLSLSAIRRAMRHYGVHPEQLAAPTPASRLSSPHPNHCWQIDASVSRQFYLADTGTQVMPQREFYRGKPQNFERISDRRLWRYVVTDHASGDLEVFYVQGAESGANLVASLIYAMTPRPGAAMHGVPRFLMADPGSAVTSATTKNFCDSLGITLIVNEVGNARAKGQVESAQYIVETNFEAPLKLRAPVTSLEEINLLAAEWSRAFSATRIHSRTGLTRRDGWLRITPEQLVLAPSVDTLRELATTTPIARTVRDYRIKHGGKLWDVSGLPGVLNGAAVEVVKNALDPNTLRVLVVGEDGRPGHYLAPAIEFGDFGFERGAAQIGSSFRAVPETPVDAARKEIERLAMDVQTDAEAAAKRKRKTLAFNGEIDPHKHIRETTVPVHVPRAGTASTVAAPALVDPTPVVPQIRPQYAPVPLSHHDMARGLKRRVEQRGGVWTAELYAQMAVRWPEGAPEEQLDDCAVALLRGGLRAVGAA